MDLSGGNLSGWTVSSPDGVQRGSVADMPFYPGDPLTPGVGATKDAKRLKIEEGRHHHKNSRAAGFLTRTPDLCSPR